jgi:hypothetical protein
MAPALANRQALPAPPPAATPQASTPAAQPPGQPSAPPMAMTGEAMTGGAMTGGAIPDQMRAMLQRMRAEVEKHCDYVGPEFAAEARKIHRGESEQRGIYGETTPEQAEALNDEGIEFARIPWVPRADG